MRRDANGQRDDPPKRTQPSRFVRIFSSPVVPALTAVLGTLTGFWASIHSGAIKGALPAFSAGKQVFGADPHVVVFWLLLAVFGTGYVVYQLAQSRKTKLAQDELYDQASNLGEWVRDLRSLPPHGFVGVFREEVARAHVTGLVAFDPNATREDLGRAVRNVLGRLVGLARSYDGAPAGVSHSANLMLFRDQASVLALPEAERAVLIDRVRFREEMGFDLAAQRGLLELARELSAAGPTGERDAPPDGTAPEIVLPVPAQPRAKSLSPRGTPRQRALPGAPYAAANEEYAAFEDIERLKEWCRDDADFNQETRDAIAGYFDRGDGRQVKSFVSTPIFAPKAGPNPSRSLLAVVNLQSDAPGILRREGHKLFIPLAQPFFVILGQLLLAYAAAKR